MRPSRGVLRVAGEAPAQSGCRKTCWGDSTFLKNTAWRKSSAPAFCSEFLAPSHVFAGQLQRGVLPASLASSANGSHHRDGVGSVMLKKSARGQKFLLLLPETRGTTPHRAATGVGSLCAGSWARPAAVARRSRPMLKAPVPTQVRNRMPFRFHACFAWWKRLFLFCFVLLNHSSGLSLGTLMTAEIEKTKR